MNIRRLFPLLAVLGTSMPALGWDYPAHRVANQLALASLPTNFPAFVHTPAAVERIAFLSGEPDRWRNVKDLATSHDNGPDHYIDLEELAEYGLKPSELTPFRYDFVAKLALVRAASPDKFPPPDPAKNADHTRELVGLLPWTLAEYYGKLKSAFAYLKTFEQYGGTPEEIHNAQENIIQIMGVMGHFAGDAAQPLHTTVHHHGWVGPNPNHYTTNTTIHQWIDGGFFAKTGSIEAGNLRSRVRPARALPDSGKGVEVFAAIVPVIVQQNQQVEPLYQKDKDGQLHPGGEKADQGRAFLEAQLLVGAQLLGDLWLSAWQNAPADNYLRDRLRERQAGKNAAPDK